MLPFLKIRKNDGGIATQIRNPDEDKAEPSHDGMQGVEVAMKELCDAMEAKDHKKMAIALKDAFEILDSMPHDEGEHTNEESEQE